MGSANNTEEVFEKIISLLEQMHLTGAVFEYDFSDAEIKVEIPARGDLIITKRSIDSEIWVSSLWAGASKFVFNAESSTFRNPKNEELFAWLGDAITD